MDRTPAEFWMHSILHQTQGFADHFAGGLAEAAVDLVVHEPLQPGVSETFVFASS